jgi:preprotein translocase subunit SecG
MLNFLLIVIFVLVCLFLMLVVLLQQGSGADLAGAFGGAGTQTSFGPRTSVNVMHRLTTIFFVLFMLLAMTLTITTGRTSSVISGHDADPAEAKVNAPVAGEAETEAEAPTDAKATEITPEVETEASGAAGTDPASSDDAPEAPAETGAAAADSAESTNPE